MGVKTFLALNSTAQVLTVNTSTTLHPDSGLGLFDDRSIGKEKVRGTFREHQSAQKLPKSGIKLRSMGTECFR